MDIQSAIQSVIDKKNLSNDEMRDVMQSIMTGECTDAQIAGFLVGLRSKGETVDEITAAAHVMRELASRVQINHETLIDTCGTGGDGSNTFNISTTAAFVVAAAGGRVAKHGNRSVSSKSGSADVLEAAGVKLELTPEQVAQCVEEIGIGFMFAPMHHSAMKHAIGARKKLGVRTVFNVLGPLTNPAGAKRQVMGVFSHDWLETLANVLKNLGSEQVMIVHSEDGMDEISISAPTNIAELKDGEIKTYKIEPEQFGMQRADINTLAVEDVEESFKVMQAVLDNQGGPTQDIVLLNAGAAIYTAGIEDTLAAGIESAKRVIEDGSARAKLDELVNLTQTF
ncbi:MAG: anthranilate phosphoribosyltransferase [Gammaproteobacteria bacterium]|nr:MAG: anthranilate phosphoribosyltransferase [Gammaproteobacteria bacterium]RKZ71265.1 MAG: anthranilate phosphoribosyltransferase [Gammaproteobacteria bacterium]